MLSWIIKSKRAVTISFVHFCSVKHNECIHEYLYVGKVRYTSQKPRLQSHILKTRLYYIDDIFLIVSLKKYCVSVFVDVLLTIYMYVGTYIY